MHSNAKFPSEAERPKSRTVFWFLRMSVLIYKSSALRWGNRLAESPGEIELSNRRHSGDIQGGSGDEFLLPSTRPCSYDVSLLTHRLAQLPEITAHSWAWWCNRRLRWTPRAQSPVELPCGLVSKQRGRVRQSLVEMVHSDGDVFNRSDVIAHEVLAQGSEGCFAAEVDDLTEKHARGTAKRSKEAMNRGMEDESKAEMELSGSHGTTESIVLVFPMAWQAMPFNFSPTPLYPPPAPAHFILFSIRLW